MSSSLMKTSKYTQYREGFTIVELLIVIVVIGILAAITIVAYNGIQTRAENIRTTNAVGEYVKGILAYSSINGTYPVDAAWPCLGVYPTSCAKISGPGGCFGFGSTTGTAGFDSSMKQIFSGSMPQPSNQTMNCGGSMFGGAWYNPSTGKAAQITYFLRGNQTCGDIGGVQSFNKQQQDDATACNAYLPTLP